MGGVRSGIRGRVLRRIIERGRGVSHSGVKEKITGGYPGQILTRVWTRSSIRDMVNTTQGGEEGVKAGN